MRYIKTYEGAFGPSKLSERTITEIKDVLVDVSDECKVDVVKHSIDSRSNRILYEITATYKVDDRSPSGTVGENVIHSIDTSEDIYNKAHKISSELFSSLKRLESLGYELVYRKIESWSLNDGTGFDAKIQLWK